MKKKLIAWLLVICMAISLLPAAALADTAAKSGKCGDNVTWVFSDDGTLTISGKGKMWDYGTSTHGDAPWAYIGVKNVVVNDGVTTIGEQAFAGLFYLESASIPKSVNNIGRQAFHGSNLKSVTIAGSNTVIETEAFYLCDYLETLTIMSGTTKIGSYAFSGCSSLKSITLPDSVTQILDSAFQHCSKLETIRIPKNVKTIYYSTFADCTNLKNVEFNNALTKIDKLAFYNCTSLETLSFPASLKTIGESAFSGCTSLKKAELPDGLQYIKDYAFIDAPLENLTVPSKLVSIGREAFRDGSFDKVVIPASLKEIGWMSFGKTVDSYDVDENNPIFVMVDGVVWNADESIIIGCGNSQCKEGYVIGYATEIYPYAFANCTNLKEILFMGDCPGFGDQSFLNCTVTIACPNTFAWKDRAIGDNFGGKITWVPYDVPATKTPQISLTTDASTGKPLLKWADDENAVAFAVYRSTSKTGDFTLLDTPDDAKYLDTSAVPGRTYYYMVTAVDMGGKEKDSAIKSITCDCARPVVSITTNASSGKPSLKWNAVDGAAKYEVYRATSKNGTYTKMYTTTSTSYTNSSAVPGTTYYYKVKAICGKSSYGNSAYSVVKSITCDCARPTVTVKCNENTGKPVLSWKAVDGASKYYIYRSTDGGKTYKYWDSTSKTSYTNSGAEAGKTYYYKVKAVCGKSSYGNSAQSLAKSIVCDCEKPVLSITAVNGKPKLSWNAVDGATKYWVYRSTDGKNFKYYDTTTKLSYTNMSTTAGTTYYYKLKAVNGSTNYDASALSNAVSLKVK
ncbi:MAG: leucine-rich repeat protein [Oscillospiraceae bacterium]|nr:leucine-rich repeat protein [Oscillospiraceae bacterium]